jgi:hypothetical protein
MKARNTLFQSNNTFSFKPVDDFFEKVVKFPRSALTDSLLALLGKCGNNVHAFHANFSPIDTKNDTAINFGEFAEVLVLPRLAHYNSEIFFTACLHCMFF